MNKHNLKTKIIAVGSLLGASLVPMSSAIGQAVQSDDPAPEVLTTPAAANDTLTVTASYNLLAAPKTVSIEQTANLLFNDIYLSSTGPVTKTADEVTVAIVDGTNSLNYSLTLSAASCTDDSVSLAPVVSYGLPANPVVVQETNGSIAFDENIPTLNIGGTLTARADADLGASSCTFTVNLVAAKSPSSSFLIQEITPDGVVTCKMVLHSLHPTLSNTSSGDADCQCPITGDASDGILNWHFTRGNYH